MKFFFIKRKGLSPPPVKNIYTEYYKFIIFSIKIIMAAFCPFATGKPPKNRLSALPAFASIPALRSGTPCGGATILAAKKRSCYKNKTFFFNSKIFYKTRNFQLQQQRKPRCRYSSGVSLRMKHKFPLARNARIFRKRKTAETCGCNHFRQAQFFYKTRNFRQLLRHTLRCSRPLGCCPFP